MVAGILATKASDSSRELKQLLKIKDINNLLTEADKAANRSKTEQERLKNLTNLVAYEVEQQFSRQMLVNHKRQLLTHWEQIQKLESILITEEASIVIDEKVRKNIQDYILRTQYFEYFGKGFLKNIPIFGRLLDYLIGPLWNTYYLKYIHNFNNIFRREPKKNDKYINPQNPNAVS